MNPGSGAEESEAFHDVFPNRGMMVIRHAHIVSGRPAIFGNNVWSLPRDLLIVQLGNVFEEKTQVHVWQRKEAKSPIGEGSANNVPSDFAIAT